jgi:hypothetical protein
LDIQCFAWLLQSSEVYGVTPWQCGIDTFSKVYDLLAAERISNGADQRLSDIPAKRESIVGEERGLSICRA